MMACSEARRWACVPCTVRDIPATRPAVHSCRSECRSQHTLQLASGAYLRALFTVRHTDTHTLRIPKVFYYGCLSSNSAGGTCIIMEHLDFSSGSDQAALGQQLARMHLATAKVRCTCRWAL